VLLDKPSGPSSHQVAAWVRDIFGVEKAGHAGTLDPNVTGLLPIGIANATKVLSTLKDRGKEYVGEIVLHDDVDDDALQDAIETFTGEIYQRPPKKSAVERTIRTREIHELELIERDDRHLLVRVDCQGGTYIRKLAADIGTYLGTNAHLQELRRTRVGPLSIDDAVTLHDAKDGWEEFKETGRDDWLRDTVLPYERFLDHLPRVTVRDTAVDAICHGAPLALPGVLDVDRTVSRGDLIVMMTLKGEAIALGKAKKSAFETVMHDTGVVAEPNRRLMDPGTYPKGWDSEE
jgi:H/ACA ribonucleoprotein complex subunit 4